MRAEPIHDPVLNMDAFFVALPVGWHFQGAVFQGTGCSPIPFPVFRASSPDGLTQLERLPRLDWKWGNGPYQPRGTPSGCLPLREEMSPSEFLQHVSAMLEVQYVAEVPVPAEKVAAQRQSFDQLNARSAQYAERSHTPPIIQHGEMAQAKVRYRNGSFAMEGLLFVDLDCIQSSSRGFRQQTFTSETCSALVRVVRAPQGKLDDAVRSLELAGARMNPEWDQAWREAVRRRTQAIAQQAQANFNQQMQLQNQQFQQSQAVQQHLHEQFLSTMQRGTDLSMQRAAQSSAANHTAASDVVDYALGRQTVRDPNTGQVSKVSGSYNNTWVNKSGTQSFQTSDPNVNPNGYQPGNWTRQQQVHGDGTGR